MLAAVAALALILYACSDSGSGKKKPVGDGKSTSTAASQSSVPTAGGSTASGAASGGVSSSGPASSAGAPTGSAGAPTGSAAGTGGATGGPGGTTGGTKGGTVGGAAGGTNGGTNGGAQSGAPAGTGCQLTLSLSSQATQYANGDQPAFTVTAFNKGTADCDIDMSPKSLVLNIFSGSDRIWSSADCGSADKDLRGIAPGGVQTVTLTWNRVRSAAGCPGGTQTAKLGNYYGVVSLAGGTGPAAPAAQSQPKVFELKSGS